MKKTVFIRVLAAFAVYVLLYVICSSAGLIHPVFYAYMGTFIPLLFAFVYLYTAANMRCFGAALALNGPLILIGLLTGEGGPSFVIGLAVLTALAEAIRWKLGYDTLKGVRLSFIPFALSFYAYTSHWWTDTAGSLEEAKEIMPAGYPDKMLPVIKNVPVLIIMIILTVPVAIVAVRLAEKVLRNRVPLVKSLK